MTENGNQFDQLEKLLDDALWDLECACLVLGVDFPSNEIPIKANINIENEELLMAYDESALIASVNSARASEIAVRIMLEEYRGKTTYTESELVDLARNVYEFVLRFQYLSTIAAAKPFYETYQHHIKNNPNALKYYENLKQFAKIQRGFMLSSNRRVSKLAELYEIAEIPKSAIDYFMEQGDTENDRRKWLRERLKGLGLYVGTRGRPKRPKPAQE